MKSRGCGLFFVFVIVVFGAIFFVFQNEPFVIQENEERSLLRTVIEDVITPNEEDTISTEEGTTTILPPDHLQQFMGKSSEFILEVYGQPSRIDRSAYDYDWWVYPMSNSYMQIGIEDNNVVTIYFIGTELVTSPFDIGKQYEQLQREFNFQEQISLNVINNSYQYHLTPEEVLMKPLVKLNEDLFVQLYFDSFSKQLSAVRYINGETLVKHRPYSVVYRGQLLEAKLLTAEEWRDVEHGLSLQILAITNEIRKRHQLKELEWDEDTANVAYYHSKDMKENDYFSHTSPTNGELQDRLKEEGILYQLAGENIAAKYVDAIAVVEGWLNSEGHRVNLLHDEFTHLGVGVFEQYYTQNFLTPW